MTVDFAPETLCRLEALAAAEGKPAGDVIRDAVAFWTLLDADERRAVVLAGMSMALKRVRGGDA